MRQAVLLGSAGTKRSDYFKQAAEKEGLPVQFVDWKDWERDDACLPEGELFVKIDPPVWESCRLGELRTLTGQYRAALQRLAEQKKERRITFFNDPSAILTLLDKRACKQRLREAGLPVTEELPQGCGAKPNPGQREPEEGAARGEEPGPERVRKGPAVCAGCGAKPNPGQREPEEDAAGREPGPERVRKGPAVCAGREAEREPGGLRAEGLLECMRQQRIFQVFLKPVYGSGAAGVSAFRFQPKTGRMMLYTCAKLHPEYGLVNTKRLRCFSKKEEIIPLLEAILGLSCIVERWYPKAEHEGYSYDFRMVMQEGEPDFLLARLSKGPITNLHLNNHPMEVSGLGLPGRVQKEAAELCRRAMDCFPGLSGAGIDLLPERGRLSLRVIEMNAQGDLMYQDIFHENRIYRHQAARMRQWLEEGK
ncbi:MAG: hypothetical protein HFI35_13370 [Roseburia sp.]|jgi:hypothetical protein|nr:hypothetical protein [Roseburia sp.]